MVVGVAPSTNTSVTPAGQRSSRLTNVRSDDNRGVVRVVTRMVICWAPWSLVGHDDCQEVASDSDWVRSSRNLMLTIRSSYERPGVTSKADPYRPGLVPAVGQGM